MCSEIYFSVTENFKRCFARIFSTFKFTPNYEVSFNYPQLWQNYATLCTSMQIIFTITWSLLYHVIANDEWPLSSPDLHPLDYCVWGAMLQAFHKVNPKPKATPELKKVHCSRYGMTCRRQQSISDKSIGSYRFILTSVDISVLCEYDRILAVPSVKRKMIQLYILSLNEVP